MITRLGSSSSCDVGIRRSRSSGLPFSSSLRADHWHWQHGSSFMSRLYKVIIYLLKVIIYLLIIFLIPRPPLYAFPFTLLHPDSILFFSPSCPFSYSFSPSSLSSFTPSSTTSFFIQIILIPLALECIINLWIFAHRASPEYLYSI